MIKGLDYAGGRPEPADIAAAGVGFVCRYLSDGGAALPGKQLLPGEADALRAAGIDIVSNWETTADRMLDGYSAGVADANAAIRQVLSCGGRSDRPIYFSADFDATPAQQTPIDAYLQGCASVLGPANVGVYGGYWVVSRALNDGVAAYAWQTQAWSGGQQDQRIAILQDNEAGYADVDGVQCDVDWALTTDYGQWSYRPKGGVMTGPNPDVPLTQKYFTDFVTGYIGPEITDTKTVREQLTGARNDVYTADGRLDVQQSYPGWPQLGGHTLVDAVAQLLEDVEAIKAKLGA
ncbi:DUF1906 domain-containing protein [Tsukamurella soli]|uniref:Rv2525c-like glycoside hydrolase-like domain-containing protein n=1 Tax=Tsukamurella soli TaxID=644556 RepID=A0ABP8JQT9_9ACTN